MDLFWYGVFAGAFIIIIIITLCELFESYYRNERKHKSEHDKYTLDIANLQKDYLFLSNDLSKVSKIVYRKMKGKKNG